MVCGFLSTSILLSTVYLVFFSQSGPTSIGVLLIGLSLFTGPVITTLVGILSGWKSGTTTEIQTEGGGEVQRGF